MEQDTIKQNGPVAVYHYSIIGDGLMDSRDGVITMPVIAGAGDYELAKHLIAEEEGIPVDGMRLTSLSFVGETVPQCQHETWGEMLDDCGK